ncbi:MAG: hypothetical protein JSV34_02025 [Candidatus Omnitrophota bacterium]|nr:MAG: hypothetical protein JSV34_02025 [Candidatus Omnitrophota bacterium]
MIRNKLKLVRFYEKLISKERNSYKKALLIYEALYKEAIALGVINSKNILDGLEKDIKIAHTINGLP